MKVLYTQLANHRVNQILVAYLDKHLELNYCKIFTPNTHANCVLNTWTLRINTKGECYVIIGRNPGVNC